MDEKLVEKCVKKHYDKFGYSFHSIESDDGEFSLMFEIEFQVDDRLYDETWDDTLEALKKELGFEYANLIRRDAYPNGYALYRLTLENSK